MMDRVTVRPINSLETESGCTAVGRSDVGRARSENQDFMGLFRTEDRVLAVVADGMGGHSGGYEASRITVDALRAVLLESPQDPPAELLRKGIELAHTRIQGIASVSPDLKGMGTTVVAVLITGGAAWFAHVGDSRAYILREGAAYLQTLDHSRVHRMLLEGMIKADQVANHPMGHILERSVGASPVAEPDISITPISLQTGDRIVLMSDGIWSIVSDDEIANLGSLQPLALAAEALLGAALTRMADDNSTVIILESTSSHRAAALRDVRELHGIHVEPPPTRPSAITAPSSSPTLRAIPPVWIGASVCAALGLALAAWSVGRDTAAPPPPPSTMQPSQAQPTMTVEPTPTEPSLGEPEVPGTPTAPTPTTNRTKTTTKPSPNTSLPTGGAPASASPSTSSPNPSPKPTTPTKPAAKEAPKPAPKPEPKPEPTTTDKPK
jgi:protein phosphatase